MRQYTAHWEAYKRKSRNGLLYMLAIVLCLPAIAVAGWGLSQVSEHSFYFVAPALLLWLIVFVWSVRVQSRVPCPRCGTVFSRGKYLSNCPSCGLRMLQEDP